MKLRNSNPRNGSNKAWLPVAVALALGVTACDRDRSQVDTLAGTTVPVESDEAEVVDNTRSADFTNTDTTVSGATTGTDAQTGMETGTTASKVGSEASGMNNEPIAGDTVTGTTVGQDENTATKKRAAKRMKKSSKQKNTTSGTTTGETTTDTSMNDGMGTDSGVTTGDESDSGDIYDRSHTPQPDAEDGIGETRDSSAIDTTNESMTDSAMTQGSSQEEMVEEDRGITSNETTMDGVNDGMTNETARTDDSTIFDDEETVSGTTTGSVDDGMTSETARTDDSTISDDEETVSGTTTGSVDDGMTSETARTTDSMMEGETEDMSGTTVGTTSGSVDQQEEQMVGETSKEKSSAQILSQFNPASIAISPYTYEPYSRQPSHIGSVQITGKDKSVAVLERMSRFTDPNALVRNTNSAIATRPLSEINISEYDFDRRGDFQSGMHARLLNLNQRMTIMRAQVLGSATEREQMLTSLSRLEGQHNALERRVDYVDAVASNEWNNWRTSFRSELAELESEIAQIGVALR